MEEKKKLRHGSQREANKDKVTVKSETSVTISDSAECYAGLSVRFESSATCM